MERDIIIEWFYPHPPEKVWLCITDADLMGQWLMKNDFKPVVGHKFRFVDKPRPAVKWNGIVYGTVTEVVPFKRISYKWQGGPEEGVVNLDTTVTWILEAKDNGTMLRLEHKGFKGMRNYFVSLMMEKGWKKMGAGRFVKILQSTGHEQV